MATPDDAVAVHKPIEFDEAYRRGRELATTAATRATNVARFAVQTPTSRFVGEVLAELARYAADRAARGAARLQADDDDAAAGWSHADDVANGERWMTLSWFLCRRPNLLARPGSDGSRHRRGREPDRPRAGRGGGAGRIV